MRVLWSWKNLIHWGMVRQNEMIYNALYVSFAANKRGYTVEKIDAQNRIDPLHEDNKRSRLRVKVSLFL